MNEIRNEVPGSGGYKIVVANWVHEDVLRELRPYGQIISNETREPWPREKLIDRCKDADALVAFMPEAIDEGFVLSCPNLKIIACALKGYDNFDVAACTRQGVWLSIVPDLLTAPTAELAVGLMISVGRNMLPGAAHVRSGNYAGWRPRYYGRSLDGSTVGLVGAGAVGKAIARRLSGFRCQLLYFDKQRLTPDEEDELRLQRVSMEELRKKSHFLVLALPLNDDTFHIVDAHFLADLQRDCYLINPARGSLVDENAVAEALEAGELCGYAADTFECEDWARTDRPAGVGARLINSEKTVLTPHIGSAVNSVRLDIAREAAKSVKQCLSGQRPDGAINTPISEALNKT